MPRTNSGEIAVWEQVLAEWRAWLVCAGRPATTIQLRMYQMRRFADDNPRPWAVDEGQVAAWLASKEWSNESRRSYRSALRSFYGWAYAAGRMGKDPAALLPPISPTRHQPRPTPETIVDDAIAHADSRLQLMLLLASRQGLRRGEIAQVHSRDVTRDLLGWSLRVHGKGDKERVIPLHDDVARRLRELDAGWAFPGQVDGHLSARWVGRLIRDALLGEWTAHTLRHRFATVAYHGSRDLVAVQELLGHSRPETTRQYVQLPDDAMRAALRWSA